MGNTAIPPGCYSSIETCIGALCAEQSQNTFKLDWSRRRPEWNALGQIDDNMSAPNPNADWHETNTRVLGSTHHSKTRWGSDQRFSEAWGHQHSTPDQKAAFRQQVARDYLRDHPDDCQPPAPPPAPVRVRKPVTRQLSLFGDNPAAASHRVTVSDEGRGAWWTTPPFAAMGFATAVAGGLALCLTEAEGVIPSLAGFALRFSGIGQKEDPVL